VPISAAAAMSAMVVPSYPWPATPDLAVGLRHYEAEHRKLTGPKQRLGSQAAAMLIPATRAGLAARNAATRLWPLAAAVSWTGRKLAHEAA
jgi:hypothetical protein